MCKLIHAINWPVAIDYIAVAVGVAAFVALWLTK